MQRDVDDRLASTDGRPLRAVWACATGGFALLAGLLVWLSRWHLNPDAVAYVQIARHYAGGRFGLAVNSWFGPLLSWLLVPAVWLGLEPVLFVRLMNVGLALGFAVGAVALTARLGGGRGRLLAYVCALLLGVTMVPWPVTPDLLLTCLLTWYFVLSLDLAFAGSPGRSLAVGLLGGLCYLAKAYALLFVVAHLVLTFAIRHVAARRRGADGGAGRGLLAALAGVAIAAGPWIAVISIHEGRPTLSGVNAQTFTPRQLDPLPIEQLQRPRDGRICVWENPLECDRPWGRWPPLLSSAGLGVRLRAIGVHSWKALGWLKGIDALGLLAVGWLGALVLSLPVRRGLGEGPATGRLWACASAAVFVGGYLLVYVEERFFWPIWAVLLALAVSVLASLRPREARPSAARRALLRGLSVALVLSTAYRTGSCLQRWIAPYSLRDEAGMLHGAAERLELNAPVVANKWYQGLPVCYWKQQPILGRFMAAAPDDIAEELAPFGRLNVLIIWDDPLADRLAEHPRFSRVDVYEHPPTGHKVHLLEFVPGR